MDLTQIPQVFIDPMTNQIWFGFEVFIWVIILSPFALIVYVFWWYMRRK